MTCNSSCCKLNKKCTLKRISVLRMGIVVSNVFNFGGGLFFLISNILSRNKSRSNENRSVTGRSGNKNIQRFFY